MFEHSLHSEIHLRKKPHGDQGQARVLSTESVVIRVEREVVEVEELQPVPLGNVRVATDRVVLIRYPHYEDDIECRRCVLEELGHDCLYA